MSEQEIEGVRESDETDVEAHRATLNREGEAPAEAGEGTGDEPDFEAHRKEL